MRLKIFSIFLILILIFSISQLTSAGSTMSYSFRVLNDPDQRQVAHNIASKQHEMSLEEDKLAQFISLIEGRIMSIISSDIVEKMLSEEGITEDLYYDTNSLDIFVEPDPDTDIVEIRVVNKESGEEETLVYNPDDWPVDIQSW